MNAHVIHPQSERGVALIIVLLMLAVLSGLATGFSMNGQTEAAMAANELYYAGARAAAEAGLNRAVERITKDTTNNLLAGPDQAFSANEADAVNADNGQTAFLFGGAAGPYTIGTGNQYSYTIDILDDDDPQLYAGGALSAAQLAAMTENGNRFVNTNQRLILRATGFGPKNTSIRIMRELFSAEAITPPETQQLLANPAILIDGPLNVTGNITVQGTKGNIHVNGNLNMSGNSMTVTGDVHATGTYTANANWEPGGSYGGGRDAITVPDIQASNYASLADYILQSDGSITLGDGSPCSPCPTGWTFSGGTWSIAGSSAPTGTFYAEGSVTISGSPGTTANPVAMSVIAEGSISISGSPKLKPENGDKIQFVTNGDLIIAGVANLDDPTNVDGQIMVREQLSISGNPKFQGRVMVGNEPSVFGDVTANQISGNPTITYSGTLGDIVTEIVIPGFTTYVNNIRGWMEQ